MSFSQDLVSISISIVQGNQVVDLLETFNSVHGLAPETLNSIGTLATALDNNPAFNDSVMLAIDQTADTSYANNQLATKASSSPVYLQNRACYEIKLKS